VRISHRPFTPWLALSGKPVNRRPQAICALSDHRASPEFRQTSFLLSESQLSYSQVTTRFDIRLNEKNSLFLRYSHDGNHGLIPRSGSGSLPSNWSLNSNWTDQSIGSLTTVFRPNLINELRFSYWYWHTLNRAPKRAECPGECIGLGMSEISVLGTTSPSGITCSCRRAEILVGITPPTTLRGSEGVISYALDSSGSLTEVMDCWRFLSQHRWSCIHLRLCRRSTPTLAYRRRPELQSPRRFRTLNDVLQLPLIGVSIGLGDPRQPTSFRLDDARKDNIIRFYWQDRWRVRSRFTLNYGIAYHYETNLTNHDLSKPDYLSPILGSNGLSPTKRGGNNFAPSLGLVWAATRDHKTVLPAGGGLYYELPLSSTRLLERSIIGPRGTGRVVVDGSLIPNPIPGLPTVPLGRPLNFQTVPTQFTGANLLSILPSVRAGLTQQFGNPNNTDLSIRNIELFKQGSGVLAQDFVSPYSRTFQCWSTARDLPGSRPQRGFRAAPLRSSRHRSHRLQSMEQRHRTCNPVVHWTAGS
jgi:hypothetical protein